MNHRRSAVALAAPLAARARVFELAARVDRGGSSERVTNNTHFFSRGHKTRVSDVCVGLVVGVGCSHFPKACRGRSISFQEHASFQGRGSSSSESAKPRPAAVEAAAAVSSPYEQGRAGQRGDVLQPPAEPNATPPARRTRRRRARAEGVLRPAQVAGAPERTAQPSDHRPERRSRVVRAVRAGWVTNHTGATTWGCARAWSL